VIYVLHERVRASGIKIIYPQFVHAQAHTKNIIGLWHGWDRLLNPNTGLQKLHYHSDSLWTMLSIKWNDVKLEDRIWMVNVTNFDVPITDKNSIVKNARVQNSRINRNFNSWRGVMRKQQQQQQLKKHQQQRGRGGLLIKWGRK